MLYDEETINAIRDILIEKEETLAVAESVTSGHIQAAFSAGLEASKYFQGGLTVYNVGQKARHLQVDPIHCNKVNCVSEKVAETMAVEISKKFLSSYGLAITGYASIVPECEKDGLFAFFSIAHEGKIVLTERFVSSKEKPVDVQVDYAAKAVLKVYEHLQSQENRKVE